MEETIMNNSAAEPMRNHDGSVMLDEGGRVVYRSQFLATHPLRTDCKERMSGGKLLTYVTGDGVIRTLNQAFGNEGWSTSITRERQVSDDFDKGNWVVGYVVTLKLSILKTGASHEDCGVGEGCHQNKLKALDNAMKSAVTDAMKRAARHFGERLGNALYTHGSGMNRAPRDNKTALRDLERQEASDLFGNQHVLRVIARARNVDAAATTSIENQNETVASTGNAQGVLPPTATLERQTTPPLSNVTNSGGSKENSPSQLGHGFARASEVAGIMVTPGQQQTNEMNAASANSSATTSPQQHNHQGTSPSTSNKPSPPPRFASLNTQPSPANNTHHQPGDENPLKRQKVVHNPYQLH